MKYLGHEDWRVPTKSELNVLWENHDDGALKGTFNRGGSDPAGWHWSSTEPNIWCAWAQRFTDGNQSPQDNYGEESLRCVCG